MGDFKLYPDNFTFAEKTSIILVPCTNRVAARVSVSVVVFVVVVVVVDVVVVVGRYRKRRRKVEKGA